MPYGRTWTLRDLELLEYAPDAMMVVDAQGRIVFVNSQTEHLFGYSFQELMGQGVERLVPSRWRTSHRLSREQYNDQPRSRPMGAGLDLRGVRKDGMEVPLDISLSPIDLDGGPSVIAAIRDITERKHAERELREADRRFRRDLDAAAAVQKSLLPKTLPSLDGFRFAWAFEPCERLAGDSFNIFMTDDQHVAFYLLDVSGHGVVAALQAVALTRVLASAPWPLSVLRRIRSPAEVAAELNRQFPIDPDTWQYFTFLCGTLDIASSELRFTSAGHPGPIHTPADGDATTLDAPGFPIGFFPDARYEELRVVLKCGDRLYFHSDGATDATNGDGLDFGKARLIETLDRCRTATLEDSVASVVTAVQTWCGDRRLHDDLTVMAIEAT